MRAKTRTFSLLAITSLFLSAGMEKTSLTEGYRPGDHAPQISLDGRTGAVPLSNPSGRYTLVNFWAAYDAPSRIRNIRLHTKVNEMDSSRIRMYSVSLDERPSVFAGTLAIDGIEGPRQLHDPLGLRSPLYRQYNLQAGLRSFLIDARGVIVASGVRPEELKDLVK
jgi:hypothetical protein